MSNQLLHEEIRQLWTKSRATKKERKLDLPILSEQTLCPKLFLLIRKIYGKFKLPDETCKANLYSDKIKCTHSE